MRNAVSADYMWIVLITKWKTRQVRAIIYEPWYLPLFLDQCILFCQLRFCLTLVKCKHIKKTYLHVMLITRAVTTIGSRIFYVFQNKWLNNTDDYYLCTWQHDMIQNITKMIICLRRIRSQIWMGTFFRDEPSSILVVGICKGFSVWGYRCTVCCDFYASCWNLWSSFTEKTVSNIARLNTDVKRVKNCIHYNLIKLKVSQKIVISDSDM
jgi:hypothetical protein